MLENITWEKSTMPSVWAATTPLEDCSMLLDPEAGCHVDHEGFDLNVIEQEYYRAQNIILSHDPTLYKDGGGEKGTTAIIQPWCLQGEFTKLIIDHSHFVFRYPIQGAAAEQIKAHADRRPELLRLLSAQFKCGLDLCIDARVGDRIEPIVHIEWDFDSYKHMIETSKEVMDIVENTDWSIMAEAILTYNKLTRLHRIDAFRQADTRAQLLFGKNSYLLIPTI